MQTFSHKINKSGDIMYWMVTIVNNTVHQKKENMESRKIILMNLLIEKKWRCRHTGWSGRHSMGGRR